jgi:hypothetical protein
LLERKDEHSSSAIESCTVTLAPQIIESLQEDHFSCYNYFFLQRLGTIGQAIYLRTFFHFANLYEQQRGKKGLILQKRYDDICAEWLGGLTVHAKKSLIEREQLGTHLAQLVHVGFLSSYAIETAKSRPGFVITFRPGPGFFTDYERFFRHRNQGELQWSFRTDQQDIAEPLKFAHLFLGRRAGTAGHEVPFVSTSETQNAKDILEHISFEEVGDFLDYALAQAKSTKFDVKSLGGLKQYVSGYLAGREHLKAAKAAASARKKKEGEKSQLVAYDRARRQAAEELFARLPKSEQETIVGLAKGHANPSYAPRGSTLLADLAKWRIVAERHPNEIPSFADWKARQAS